MAAAARHTGLPLVPQLLPDELLGSWLLRIAQLYGLGWKTLLSRLDARQAGVARLPHWFAIDGSAVSLDALLSAATRLSRMDFAAMAPPNCRPSWPEELGACATCLAAASVAGQPIAWSQNWMSPLSTVCKSYGAWLAPVSMRALAGIQHADDLDRLVDQLAVAQPPEDEPAGARDAMWLQDVCTQSTAVDAPWARPARTT